MVTEASLARLLHVVKLRLTINTLCCNTYYSLCFGTVVFDLSGRILSARNFENVAGILFTVVTSMSHHAPVLVIFFRGKLGRYPPWPGKASFSLPIELFAHCFGVILSPAQPPHVLNTVLKIAVANIFSNI